MPIRYEARLEVSVSEETATSSLGALAPLRRPVFRMLWGAWLVANTCMWMNDVAAAWIMTTLSASPLWVALVQTASALPVFLFGLPCGALADIVDRRRYFIATQFFSAGVAVILCLTLVADAMTPLLLLVMVFANGIGLAMRWPVFTAVMPDLVPRAELATALALGSVAMNASRIFGPLIAGVTIASAGITYVFALNALLSIITGTVIMRWRHDHKSSLLGQERLLSAMRVGLQFVVHSSPFQSALLRVFLFFFHSTALLALLPLVARDLGGGEASSFTLLLASMGSGAVAAALFLPRVRQTVSRNSLMIAGTLLQSAAMTGVALTSHFYLAVASMFMGGAAWIATTNALNIAAQMALPDWVRARGMSMFIMAIMAASALGAALWGQVASLGSVQISLIIASSSAVVSVLMAHWLLVTRDGDEDLTPSRELNVMLIRPPVHSGRVLIITEYIIDPTRTEEFLLLMQKSRRSTLQRGALAWNLLNDMDDPARYLEQITDNSWTEYVRQFDRFTATDVAWQEKKLQFHVGKRPPTVARFVINSAP